MLYDQSWGGIISCGCWYNWLEEVKHGKCKDYSGSLNACPTLTDPGFDYGNGFYNDHHFHYGYFIYSAAVVARFNASWVKDYNEKVLVLVRDIANPSPSDPYFAPFRYFDWFVGHSWASGLVANPLGRNQESTSEAVNAWYGIYLYGEATKNNLLQTIGESMFLFEVHSTNTYWHVPVSVQIYPKKYEHKMIGILHELLIEFQTYFGQSGYFVHGIQLLPITPVVHLMFHPRWLATGLPKFKQFCEGDAFCMESGFIAFYYAELALVDKKSAWIATTKLSDKVFGIECAGGNGNSRTNTLYFIASWGNHPEPNWTDLDQDVCQGPLLAISNAPPAQTKGGGAQMTITGPPKDDEGGSGGRIFVVGFLILAISAAVFVLVRRSKIAHGEEAALLHPADGSA
jgi:endo-1,3(4)-beta-glucanase